MLKERLPREISWRIIERISESIAGDFKKKNSELIFHGEFS